jgi:H+/gluconate symporter-like permease
VIALLPGFILIKNGMQGIANPLLREASAIMVLCGLTGSASGGLTIGLGSMGDSFVRAAQAAHIPMEVLHRIASMASGSIDTLPHNGSVLTLLLITGLTHRQAYGAYFGITVVKTLGLFFVLGLYFLTGWV